MDVLQFPTKRINVRLLDSDPLYQHLKARVVDSSPLHCKAQLMHLCEQLPKRLVTVWLR
jgi:hypothetical protein